ncbi:MAG: hypothetical protein IH598_02305 [Bacteroidales bacterium]|nr:hypothetical protein [Bacteroidales bacterium]
MSKKEDNIELNQKQIKKGTEKGLKKYKKLGFFEEYAMFMGVAQLLELGLKNLLVEKFDYTQDSLEWKTLGQTKKELEKVKLRPDFLKLLESVVDYRNYIAHEILANRGIYLAIAGDLIPDGYYDKEHRHLHKAIYELEQLVFLFQWTYENDAW